MTLVDEEATNVILRGKKRAELPKNRTTELTMSSGTKPKRGRPKGSNKKRHWGFKKQSSLEPPQPPPPSESPPLPSGTQTELTHTSKKLKREMKCLEEKTSGGRRDYLHYKKMTHLSSVLFVHHHHHHHHQNQYRHHRISNNQTIM